MSSHRLRLLVIGILTLVALIGVIVLSALGQTEGTAFGIVVGVLTTGIAAFTDASAVEARRRNPNVEAITDDVRGEGAWRDGKRLPDPHDPTSWKDGKRPEEDPHEATTKPGV